MTKQVTAQVVNTYVAPDRSGVQSTRRQQVGNALAQLGVSIKQHQAEKDEEYEGRVSLQKDAALAKIKQGLDWMRLDENKHADFKSLEANPSVMGAARAIDEIEDAKERNVILQRFKQAKEGVFAGHANTRNTEKNQSNYGAAVASSIKLNAPPHHFSTLIEKYNSILPEHGAITIMADIAKASGSVSTMDLLLDRAHAKGDVPPQVITKLTALKHKAVAADKSQLGYDLVTARDADSFTEKADGLRKAIETGLANGALKATDRELGSLVAEAEEVERKARTESVFREQVGSVHSTVLAAGESLPEGYTKLSKIDVKRIYDAEFYQAIKGGDYVRLYSMLDDPTDFPDAARETFGSIVSQIDSLDPDADLTNSPFIGKLDLLRRVEAQRGPATLQALLGDNFAKYKMFEGIADQEGPNIAAARFQEMSDARANGRIIRPEGWAETERKILEEVADHAGLDSELDVATRRGIATQFAGYLPYWRDLGYTAEQSITMAKRLYDRSTGLGLPNGRIAQEAMQSISQEYGLDPQELFDDAVEAMVEEFRKGNPDIDADDIYATILPSDPNYLVFKHKDGVPIMGALQKIDQFGRFVRAMVIKPD